MTETTPRWLQRYATPPAHAPQKAPPSGGVLVVDRWAIPSELRLHHAWACWRYSYDLQRWSKPPYNPDTGTRAEASNSDTWSSFDEAYHAYQDHASPQEGGRPYDGVSFALDPRWGIVGVDLDHVSEHQLDADRIVRALSSYTEYSPSRDGYRIFLKGSLPEGRRRRGWVEMYSQRRFLTVTGHKLAAAPPYLTSSHNLYAVWDRWLNRG